MIVEYQIETQVRAIGEGSIVAPSLALFEGLLYSRREVRWSSNGLTLIAHVAPAADEPRLKTFSRKSTSTVGAVHAQREAASGEGGRRDRAPAQGEEDQPGDRQGDGRLAGDHQRDQERGARHAGEAQERAPHGARRSSGILGSLLISLAAVPVLIALALVSASMRQLQRMFPC